MKKEMARTTLRIEKDLIKEAKKRALEKEITLQEYVNTALLKALRNPKTNLNKKPNAGEVLLKMAADAEKEPFKSPGDLSTNMFDYLYGKKSDYAKKKK